METDLRQSGSKSPAKPRAYSDINYLQFYRPSVRLPSSFYAKRRLAWLLCAAALLLKLLVPTGFMLDTNQGRLTVIICTGTTPRMMTMDVTQPQHSKQDGHGKAEMPCAFSGLSAPALAAADPIQLAALIAFVMSVALAGLLLPPPASRPYLRPPLRGPPVRL